MRMAAEEQEKGKILSVDKTSEGIRSREQQEVTISNAQRTDCRTSEFA